MSQQIVAADLTEAPLAVPKFTPGRIYIAEDGKTYQYCKSSGNMAQYEYVFITKDGNFTASSLTTTNVANAKVQFVGCNQNGTAVVTSRYWWVFRGFGAHTGLFAASCVQDVRVSPTSVAGVVDDAASQSAIVGLSLLTTIVGAAASAAWASGLLLTDGSST
jgi:hypothetical protein